MELKQEKETIDLCRTVVSCSAKQALDADLSLPDYCGDIQRILHCDVQPQLRSATVSEERATALGEITIRLHYLNEQNESDCLEQALPFSVNCRCNTPAGDAVVCAHATMEYINCRALSPRKVQLDGAVTVRFEVLEKQPFSFIRSMQPCEVQQESTVCSRMTAIAQKTFDLSETVALEDSEPSVSAILRVSGTPVIRSTEAVSDKLLVKGELQMEIICLAEDRTIHSVRHSLPISQVVEAQGLHEDDTVDVSLQLCALYAVAKRDADDAQRLLDLASKISVLVKAYREDTVQVITDCFATRGSLIPTFSDFSFTRVIPVQQTETNEQIRIETGVQNGRLLFAAPGSVQTETEYRDGAFRLLHHVSLEALIKDNDGGLRYQTQAVDVTQRIPVSDDLSDATYAPRISVRTDNVRLAANGTLEANVAIAVQGTVFDMQTRRILTQAVMEESEEPESAQLILAFCKKGEALWPICKRYRTPLNLVKAENALEQETLQEDCMLLIPAAT